MDVVNPIDAEFIVLAVKLDVSRAVKLPLLEVTWPTGPVIVDAVSKVKYPTFEFVWPIAVPVIPAVAVNVDVIKYVVDKFVKSAELGAPNPIGGG